MAGDRRISLGLVWVVISWGKMRAETALCVSAGTEAGATQYGGTPSGTQRRVISVCYGSKYIRNSLSFPNLEMSRGFAG
jgi:hypothetical protein